MVCTTTDLVPEEPAGQVLADSRSFDHQSRRFFKTNTAFGVSGWPETYVLPIGCSRNQVSLSGQMKIYVELGNLGILIWNFL